MDLAGAFSKLAPALIRIATTHRTIRSRPTSCGGHKAPRVKQQVRVDEEALLAAGARYEAGGALREIGVDLGVSRARLSSLLRAQGVRLRRTSPSDADVDGMRRRYAAGESVEQVRSRLGVSAGTVRRRFLACGVVMRDSHGRQR